MGIEVSLVVSERDVLAKDLFSKTGVLLLKAGTIITRSYKEHLRRFGITQIFVF